jgi:long-chain acyl-CoA synthetase
MTTLGCSSDLIEPTLKMKKNEQAGQDRLRKLVNIINFDNKLEKKEINDLAKEVGVRILNYSDVMEAGAKNTGFKVQYPDSGDVFLLSFTSGTTGNPKGVKISHQMIMGMLTAI